MIEDIIQRISGVLNVTVGEALRAFWRLLIIVWNAVVELVKNIAGKL